MLTSKKYFQFVGYDVLSYISYTFFFTSNCLNCFPFTYCICLVTSTTDFWRHLLSKTLIFYFLFIITKPCLGLLLFKWFTFPKSLPGVNVRMFTYSSFCPQWAVHGQIPEPSISKLLFFCLIPKFYPFICQSQAALRNKISVYFQLLLSLIAVCTWPYFSY